MKCVVFGLDSPNILSLPASVSPKQADLIHSLFEEFGKLDHTPSG